MEQETMGEEQNRVGTGAEERDPPVISEGEACDSAMGPMGVEVHPGHVPKVH